MEQCLMGVGIIASKTYCIKVISESNSPLRTCDGLDAQWRVPWWNDCIQRQIIKPEPWRGGIIIERDNKKVRNPEGVTLFPDTVFAQGFYNSERFVRTIPIRRPINFNEAKLSY